LLFNLKPAIRNPQFEITMTRDELEYSLSQYHDGMLGPVERAAIDEVLASDGNARAMLAEFERLDLLVKGTPGAPDLNWDKLQAHISAAINEAEAPVIRTFKLGAWARRIGAGVAAAALIAIVVSVTLRTEVAKPTKDKPGSIQISIAPAGDLPVEARSTGQVAVGPTAEIDVGPSPQMASTSWQYQSAFLERPSRVVIAVSPEPAQDGGASAPF
jgi:hypothetical protein